MLPWSFTGCVFTSSRSRLCTEKIFSKKCELARVFRANNAKISLTKKNKMQNSHINSPARYYVSSSAGFICVNRTSISFSTHIENWSRHHSDLLITRIPAVIGRLISYIMSDYHQPKLRFTITRMMNIHRYMRSIDENTWQSRSALKTWYWACAFVFTRNFIASDQLNEN